MHCLVLFIDFSKAFDTLKHSNLLQMMERCGVRGSSLSWFKNYLEHRSYRVKINNNLSNEEPISCGVPQGSKLGPILYLIYANEMMNTLSNPTYAYADDTAIVVSNLNVNNAIRAMQNQLDCAVKWCHDNGLIINASKTKLMHIKPRHLPSVPLKLIFHNYDCLHKNAQQSRVTNDLCSTEIEVVETYKYLGVYVDQNFKWKTHIEILRKKLRKTAYMLNHLSYCSPYTVLRQVYFSLAESYIRHGITAWGSSPHCKMLQKTQNQLMKILKKNCRPQNNTHLLNVTTGTGLELNASQPIITQTNVTQRDTATYNGANSTNQHTNTVINNNTSAAGSTDNLAKQLNLLNINSIYYITLINEFYKDNRFLKQVDHIHNTRHRAQGRYKVERFRNEYGRSTLKVTLPVVFNKMPTEIINENFAVRRKKLLKKHLISSQ